MRERQQGDKNEGNSVGGRSYATVGLCPLPYPARLHILYFENLSHCLLFLDILRDPSHIVTPQRLGSAVLLFRFCSQAMWVQISCELGKSPNFPCFTCLIWNMEIVMMVMTMMMMTMMTMMTMTDDNSGMRRITEGQNPYITELA